MVALFGREAQRREIARALVVVFEKKAVDLHLVEQDFGDRLIAAPRHPRALEIAAAKMDADRHVLRPVADRIVDELAIETRQRVRVVAARLGALADIGVAQIGEVGVVELQVAAAARGQIGDLGPVGGGQIIVEVLQARVDGLADRLAPAAEMQHRGGRDADFRRLRRHGLEKIEIRPLNRRHVPDLASDMHRRRLEADLGPVVFAEGRDEFAVMGLDAFQALEEIDMKKGAAEFPVGDPLEPHVLLRAHDLADALVLDRVKLFRRESAAGEPFARLPQTLGPKITSDMVGAERRTGHRYSPSGVLGS